MTSTRRALLSGLTVTLALASLALLAPGCELFEEDEDPGPPAPPVFTVLAPAGPVVVAPGDPVTVRIAVRDEDGAAYEGYTLAWRFPFWFGLNPPGTCAASTVEPGVEECVYRTTQLGEQAVTLEVSRCTGTRKDPKLHCATWTSPEAPVFVWGGPPRALHTPFRQAELVVGEARPLQAVVLTEGRPSHVPPSYAVADPTRAEVDARGVVRALSPGETTLVITAGELRREVALVIREGEPAPPPLDAPVPVVRQGDDTVASTRMVEVGVNRRREGTLAVDLEGRPWLVYRTSMVVDGLKATELRNAWVSTWTGSGFGFEAVGLGWDDVAYPRIAIDDRGTAWVLYHSRVERTFGLMRRVGPGHWERALLPGGSDASAPHLASESGALLPEALSDRIPLALLPRDGGGVHVAYAVFARTPEGERAETGHGCARALRLVTVEADGRLAAEDARREPYGGGVVAADCGRVAGLDALTFSGLGLAPDGDSPTILVFEERDNLGFIEATRRVGATWETRMLVPWTPNGAEGSAERPLQLGIAPPPASDPTGPTWLVWQGGGVGRFFLATLDELWAGEPEPFTTFSISPEPRDGIVDADVQLSATQLRGAVIACTKGAETLWRLAPPSAARVTLGWSPADVGASTLLRGLTSDDAHLHLSWGLGDLTWARTNLGSRGPRGFD
ncbi:MAG: hypothetical protein IT385_16215 [Deltaproteobacteria bacterium]|nr:hypothetical protein [Deltaproteobacteria bacterium]